MGALHAKTFYYQEFQHEVQQLVEKVDQRDYRALQEQVTLTVKQFQEAWPLSDLGIVRYEDGVAIDVLSQEWPLIDHGDYGLDSIEQINSIKKPLPRDLGYWFLILLAKYVQPCVGPLNNWSVVYTVLKSLGWSKSHRDLLFHGNPTYKLLKPNLAERSIKPLTEKSPYWLWLQPSRAWSGWLSRENIDMLFEKLSRAEKQVANFNVARIRNINVDNPVVIKNYQTYLRDGFSDTLAMLSYAMSQQSGLFMSINV